VDSLKRFDIYPLAVFIGFTACAVNGPSRGVVTTGIIKE
jgi:hypothetical protein